MHVEIIGIEEGLLHYEVREGDNVLSEKRVDAAELAREAAQKNVRLITLLKRKEGVSAVKSKPAPVAEPPDDAEEPAEVVAEDPSLPVATDHRHDDVMIIREVVREVPAPAPELDLSHNHDGQYEPLGHVCDHSAFLTELPDYSKTYADKDHKHPHNHDEAYAAKGHGHSELSAAQAEAEVGRTRLATEVARVGETLALHLASRELHSQPDVSKFLTREDIMAVVQAVNKLSDQVAALEARPLLPDHHHTTVTGRNLEEIYEEELESMHARLNMLEASTPMPSHDETHVHNYVTKGKNKGQWLCACGDTLTRGAQ